MYYLPESLPPQYCAPPAVISVNGGAPTSSAASVTAPSPAASVVSNASSHHHHHRNPKEPERRHSCYDRSAGRYRVSNNASGETRLSAMNINGLPEGGGGGGGPASMVAAILGKNGRNYGGQVIRHIAFLSSKCI